MLSSRSPFTQCVRCLIVVLERAYIQCSHSIRSAAAEEVEIVDGDCALVVCM